MNRTLAISGGSTLIYTGLAVLMGVLPGIWLSKVPPTPGLKPLTSIEARGRDVYVSEGCFYCHTQQVRPLSGDKPFGRPSAPGDYAYQTTELLGSERTGPDLSNIGARQSSSIWQYIHLFQPRAVVPQSIMPAFPWLFKIVDKLPPGEKAVPLPPQFAPGGTVIPNEDGKALVAYLLSLKQPPLVPTQSRAATESPSSGSLGFDATKGAALFADNCASCHGAEGKGVPGTFPPLAGDPVVNDADPTAHIGAVLHGLGGRVINGQSYEAQMPAFADQLSDQQIADIINYERSSWGNRGALISAADVVAARANESLQKQATTPKQVSPVAPPAPTFDAAEGSKLFADNCGVCHGAEGKGVPGTFPPLAGDPVVNATDPAEHITTMLRGLSGKAIDGQKYEVEMPPFADRLSDQQIADIINHERTSWGNHGPLVTPAEITKLRAEK
ncbi:cbb3-type cytochrome c oxidase subunit II [Bradyrhizobium sp. CB1650]|uniref:c-type cytochrome n=1 Tax=Bradyrhizobium sp. CB1650 TaxID=3039153 RepID=UPI00243533F6|nr:c-type cytochrome [Bradyrhizobium sp. CB1650]WGD51498.1 cbb3-type cytochrome c oxidase subunit II [Bradyrhizobium sp. CB1650]